VQVHDAFGLAVLVLAAAGAVLAILDLLRPRFMPAVRIYLRVIVAVVAIQVVIGLVLVVTGSRPHEVLHWLYGAATLVSIPIAVVVGRRLGGRDEQIWLAGGAVLTVLFALRAIATG
jgi:heme A synthase